MSWVRIDDGFTDHPKIARIGPIGAWIQLQALCYCNKNLTDGFVPFGIARSFAGRNQRVDERNRVWETGEHSGMQGKDMADVDWLQLLCDAGVWEPVPGGYRIHDFDDYQPSKAEVLKERERWVERKRRSRGVSRRDSTCDSGESHGPPVPVPVPVPERRSRSLRSLARETEFQELDYDLGLARKQGCTAPQKALDAFRAHAMAHQRRLANWRGGWVQWCLHHDHRCPCQGHRVQTNGAGRVQPTIEQTRELLKHL